MFGAQKWRLKNAKGLKKRLRIVGGEELIGAKDYISDGLRPWRRHSLKKKWAMKLLKKTATAQFCGGLPRLIIRNNFWVCRYPLSQEGEGHVL